MWNSQKSNKKIKLKWCHEYLEESSFYNIFQTSKGDDFFFLCDSCSSKEHPNYVIFIQINGKFGTTIDPRLETLKLEHHGHNNVGAKVKIAFDAMFCFYNEWYSSILRD